jgi:crossover junction endodeoxyribonuclease RuvC
MKILALDLGTKCGFCVGNAEIWASFTVNFTPKRFEGGGLRYLRFLQKLDETRDTFGLDYVCFEEVRRHMGTDAAHVYGGFMGALTQWCEANETPYEGVPVGTIKKSWTGSGNASKQAMLAECERRGIVVQDDNEADAIALFHFILERDGAK